MKGRRVAAYVNEAAWTFCYRRRPDEDVTHHRSAAAVLRVFQHTWEVQFVTFLLIFPTGYLASYLANSAVCSRYIDYDLGV